MPQGSIQWHGTQRRSCAPGAHWHVQVVRGKVTTRCLWHACKALGIGLILMLLGACMATIGYYADQLSVAQEIRGNITVRVKNESRGFHLNNLSYAGPVVMGVGGFIVVAACVMTFEARDSAAKVVPARFRFNQASTVKNSKQRSRKSTSSQTSKWDHQLGLFRVNRSPSPGAYEVSRKQLTAEFMQFSKTLQEKNVTHIKKSPSAPTLLDKKSPRKKAPKFSGCTLLNPELLQRHALSVDNPDYHLQQLRRDTIDQERMNGSQASMAMDLHLPNKGPVTLKIKDRSDTARRHQLSRQTKVVDDVEEVEEVKPTAGFSRSCSPKLPGAYSRYPDDFVSRKRSSIDIRVLEDLANISPRDFRKISSPTFGKMSLDRTGDRRFERTLGFRKASLEFRRSPDFRKADYRKYSIERFTSDCAKYFPDDLEARSRTSSGDNLRRMRHPKLYHSRSDDRRRSFDKHKKDSQASRFSLNAGPSDRSVDFELKYFKTTSLDTEESRCDNSDDSHIVDYDDPLGATANSEGPIEADALLEEPELENLHEIEVEGTFGDVNVTEVFVHKQQRNEDVVETTVIIEHEEIAEDSETVDKQNENFDTAVEIGED